MKLTLAKAVKNKTNNHIWVMQQLMEIKSIKKQKNTPELLALGLREVFHSTLNTCYVSVLSNNRDEMKHLAKQELEVNKQFWTRMLPNFSLVIYGETFKWKKFPYLDRSGDIQAPQYLHEAVIHETTTMLAKLGIKNEANNEKVIAESILKNYHVKVNLEQDKSKTLFSFLECTNNANENMTGKTEMTHKNLKTLRRLETLQKYIEFHLDRWKLKYVSLDSLIQINNNEKFKFESYSYGLLVLYALIKVSDNDYIVRFMHLYF